MTEVERQSLIDQLEDLKSEGDAYIVEVKRCRAKASITKDRKEIKHIEERLMELYEAIKDNTKKLSVVVKKLKKAK